MDATKDIDDVPQNEEENNNVDVAIDEQPQQTLTHHQINRQDCNKLTIIMMMAYLYRWEWQKPYHMLSRSK